jgi:hypothetical protein
MAMVKNLATELTATTAANVPVSVSMVEVKRPEPVRPPGRDYGAEARGKVTFGAYQAAIQSPGVLSFSASIEEFDKNIEKYAQLIIKKTWEAQNG